jgi:hypothetical protein
MDLNKKKIADSIFEHLSTMEVDGEIMQYVIKRLKLNYEILQRLMMTSSDFDINNILKERDEFHDEGSNSHLK